jgi:hypothetical protein
VLIQKYIAIGRKNKVKEDSEEQRADIAYMVKTEDDSEVDLTSDAEYSFQVQQHLAESEKCYNTNGGKIKFKERSTFRRCPSLEANLDSGARVNIPRQKQTLISINLRLIT